MIFTLVSACWEWLLELNLGFWSYFFLGFIAIFIVLGVASGGSGTLSKDYPWQFRLAASLRTPVLMFIVIPLSFLIWLRNQFKASQGARGWDVHRTASERVIKQLKDWNKAGRPGVLRTARPNWKAMSTKLGTNKKDSSRIDVSGLNNIIEVNEEKMHIVVEPGVTFGQISDLLTPMGLGLEMQVEMESITIGGVVMGFGMETNSHKIGLFQETVEAYEMATSHGDIINVTAESDPDLFYALPWSYGTLGFLLSCKLRLIKTKKYVRVEYIVTHTPQELCQKMTEMSIADDTPDYLEATIYTKQDAVIQAAYLMDEPSSAAEKARINPINYFWKPFYFKHVQTFIAKKGGWEIIPLKHYYHRFTRSIFWEIEDMIPWSNHPLYRVLWGWMGAPEVSLLKLFQGPVIRRASVYAHVVQESIMPIRELANGIENFDDWYGVYPLLVFPIRVYNRGRHSGFLHPRKELLEPGKDWGMFCDLGAYGVPWQVMEGKVFDPVKQVRKMEHWTSQIGGWVALYTDGFHTRQEFRQMFSHELQDDMRKRLDSEDAFCGVYDKTASEPGLIGFMDANANQDEKKHQ